MATLSESFTRVEIRTLVEKLEGSKHPNAAGALTYFKGLVDKRMMLAEWARVTELSALWAAMLD